jgi:hypothetical protein
MEQYPCAAMNYPTSPEVVKGQLRRELPLVAISPGAETAMQDCVMDLIFKRFNTLSGCIAET